MLTHALEASELVDLTRYPIADLSAPAGQELVADCRRQLRDAGVALLPGFVRPAAVAAMAAEGQAGAGQAFFCDNSHNAYLEPDDDKFPPHHPRRRLLRTVVGSIAYDLLAADSPLRRLYNWDPLVNFIGAVLEQKEFHRLADPLGACSINVFRPGGFHSWHFDEAPYSTTIMLQEAESGGHFEYVPHIRVPDGGEHGAIGRILDGDESLVQRLPFTAGALSLFAGHVSLHRVTEIRGKRHRLVAVLTFHARPGATNSDEVRKLFWGRTQ